MGGRRPAFGEEHGMARKMILVRDGAADSTMLTEVAADDEAQL
jgi:hypothetical protein